MTFLHIFTWALGIVAFIVIFAIACGFIIASGSVWESETEREREMRELKASIRRAEQEQQL